MALFLSRKNNLADLENRDEARQNLGLGSIATQNSDAVSITGGNITVDELYFNLDQYESQKNKFLYCESNGRVTFQDIRLPSWISGKTAKEISLNNFNLDDILFLPSNSPHRVALTGSYYDLNNVPTSIADFDIDLDFVVKSSNLADLTDAEVARSNLGIGTTALINSHNALNLEQLTVDFLFFSNVESSVGNPTYLYIDSLGIVTPTPLIHASTSNYGVVLLSSNENDLRSNSVPSTKLFKEVSDILDDKITALSNNDPMGDGRVNEYIADSNLMKIANNLSELSNPTVARQNLGFDSDLQEFVEKMNDGKMIFNDVHITKDLIFNPGYVNDTINNSFRDFEERQFFLTTNKADFKVRLAPINIATSDQYGVVKLITSLNQQNIDNDPDEYTMNSATFCNYIETNFWERFTQFSNSIPLKIQHMYSEHSMKVGDNLLGVDATRARHHLLLHKVAYTGDYFDLKNGPCNVSYFTNDNYYLMKESNLSEFDPSDIYTVKRNLNIGSIASYDSNNVEILGGTGTFSNLTISNSFHYAPTTNISQKYLFCTNSIGTCAWEPLPVATTFKKGIVKLQTDYTISSDQHASSASALVKAYYDLTGKIKTLQGSLESIKKTIGMI